MKNKQQLNILYVEDDKLIRDEMTEILAFDFPSIHTAKDGVEAYNLYQENQIDMIICDVQMPNMDGLQLSRQVLTDNPNLPIILTTAFNESTFRSQAEQIGIKYFVNKPIVLSDLDKVIQQCLDNL